MNAVQLASPGQVRRQTEFEPSGDGHDPDARRATVIEIQPADPQVVYVPSYNPEYIWGPPIMVIIRRFITRKSALDLGSARVFISEDSSAASVGAVGLGAKSVRPFDLREQLASSITMVSTAEVSEAAEGLEEAGAHGRTIRGTG